MRAPTRLHVGRGRVLEQTRKDPTEIARPRARARRPRVVHVERDARGENGPRGGRDERARQVGGERGVYQRGARVGGIWVGVQRRVGDLGCGRGGECHRGDAFFRRLAGGAAVQGGLWSALLIRDGNLGRLRCGTYTVPEFWVTVPRLSARELMSACLSMRVFEVKLTANVRPTDNEVGRGVEELGCKRLDAESHRVHAGRVRPT